MFKKLLINTITLVLVLIITQSTLLCLENPSSVASWAATLYQRYRITSNITYLTADNWEAKLDIYQPTDTTSPTPTVIYFHAGGWIGSDKDVRFFHLFQYLEMGWAVVNVEYRLARVALAPAAVEDCRCALSWVINHAEEYNFDPEKIVVAGKSAGGHLSLTTGMLPASAGLDRRCLAQKKLKVAAIINWYGITDVNDLLDGPNMKGYAVAWFGSLSNRQELAKRVSPLTYVRPGLPPILTIHGDVDATVPYSHAVRLHKALTSAGVPNQLLTIAGGKHGGFTEKQVLKINSSTVNFLKQHGFEKRVRSVSLP